MIRLFFKDLPRLQEGDIEGGDLTFGEMEDAIKEMKGGKSPGLDGIGIEFYKL